jgi:hypothetical protein
VISRIVDGAATPQDWYAFRAMAERDATLWRELAEWQHDHAELTASVNAAIAVADGVDVDVQAEMTRRFSERVRTVATWGGWVAAAALTLAWATGVRNQQTPSAGSQAGLVNIGTANDAFNEYLTKGKEAGWVVGEVPRRVLIDARPTKSGAYEVIYLRQVMERRTVKEIERLSTDEFGNPVAIPAKPAPVLYEVPPADGAGPY